MKEEVEFTGLDVLDEMLNSVGSRARAAMATEGTVGSLARLLPMKGIGQRAAQVCVAAGSTQSRFLNNLIE